MSITTKTGDDGTTAVFGGKRVKKNDPQIEVCGAVDEATSFIGLAIESIFETDTKDLLSDTQIHLYLIMAFLSGSKVENKKVVNYITYIEKNIYDLENKLPKLIRFVLPQGSEQTARLHMARTMVRKAERRAVRFINNKKQLSKDDLSILQYLNRLSDLLFLLARKYSLDEKTTKEV